MVWDVVLGMECAQEAQELHLEQQEVLD